VVPGAPADTFPWHQLRFQHAAAIRASVRDAHAPATGNKILAALRGVLKHAFALGLIAAEHYQHVQQVESIKGVRVVRGRALPTGELRALFGACDPNTTRGARNAAMLAILYGGGLRRSEVVSLDLADFEATTGTLLVGARATRSASPT
jgi:integrase/recombinase XerD